MMEIGNYKPERGLIEVFTNLSGSYETLESIASRINISTTKVYTLIYYIIKLYTSIKIIS